MPAHNVRAMQEPFPSHPLGCFIPKYVWFDFLFVGA